MALRVALTVAWLLALAELAGAFSEVRRFVIMSAPRHSLISYVPVGRRGATPDIKPSELVRTGLVTPQGLAVDHKRSRLLVADPGLNQVLGYDLSISSGGGLSVGDPLVMVRGTEPRWVAVDNVGNIFVTDEGANQVLRIPADSAIRGSGAATIVYDGKAHKVDAPAGIAVDNFFVYWSNKQENVQVGSIARGAEMPPKGKTVLPDTVQVLAQQAQSDAKPYGICLAMDNVFYGDATSKLWAVKKNGAGEPVVVSKALSAPRGCAWDGDGTVYVADKGSNKVYSIPGNMKALSALQITHAVDFDDAFGVTVFSGCTGQWVRVGLVVAAAIGFGYSAS